jgi:hypothetical protein
MVDKDGKVVDIMADLERLEGEMNAYLIEVKELHIQASKLDSEAGYIYEKFNPLLPQ